MTISPDLDTDLRTFETRWGDDVDCLASDDNHKRLLVNCSGPATHRLHCTCGGKGSYPVCANVAASVTDPVQPAICRLHRKREHVIVTEL